MRSLHDATGLSGSKTAGFLPQIVHWSAFLARGPIACRFVVYEGARPRRESMGECYPFAPKRSTIASTIALAARSAPAMARASAPSGAGASGLSQALAVDSGEKTLL